MRKPRRKSRKSDPVEQNRTAIARARGMVDRTPLADLMSLANIAISPDHANSVDADTGAIYLNSYVKAMSPEYWSGVIAHMLLHLGLNHAARREERDPLLWNSVCEHKVDLLLPMFGFNPPGSTGSREDDEQEEISYDNLVRELDHHKRLGKSGSDAFHFRFGSGSDRPDILGLGKFHPWRKDYEEALARGITRTVEDAVANAAEALTHEGHSPVWGPVGRAKRWVMNELPLFGALAAQIHIIADTRLCERMDIGVAAVNGWLGEMYFNPDRGLSDAEVLFIYVHELLHVALLHRARVQGRDP